MPRRHREFVRLSGKAELRFATLDGFETRGYRRPPYGRYSIIYAVRDAEIVVLRILAASVDLQKSLFDD